jgi:putative membrane protein
MIIMPMLSTAAVIAQRWDHMNWGWGWGGGWIVMMVFMVLLTVLVVLAIVWLLRTLMGGAARERREPTAVELLDRRLADGAISVEEYEQRRRILEGRPQTGDG